MRDPLRLCLVPVVVGLLTGPVFAVEPAEPAASVLDPTPPSAQEAPAEEDVPRLMLQPVPETVYAPPPVAQSTQGYNEGALSLDITGRYMTDYIFRGLEIIEPTTAEDAINIQIDAHLRLDLGRLPDPFVEVFTNTAEGDDISNFQVIRPVVGVIWDTELFSVALANQSFTYPDRTELDTAEVFTEIHLNDGVFRGEDGPILGPFIFAAYDYDRFEGAYVAAGLEREFPITDTNFTLGYKAEVAYVDNYGGLFAVNDAEQDESGFNHYQVGLTGRYDLNSLLNISRHYGQWSIEGYLNYTDGIDNDLAATTQIWGGAGISFRY